jgi:hypothetical protein
LIYKCKFFFAHKRFLYKKFYIFKCYKNFYIIFFISTFIMQNTDAPIKTIIDEYTTEWRVDGVLHREDGPAVQYIDEGNLIKNFYYKDGRLHRENSMPAIEYIYVHCIGDNTFHNLDKYYMYHGVLNNLSGPAISLENGKIELYYINGVPYIKSVFYSVQKALSSNTASKDDTQELTEDEFNARPKKTVLKDGTIEWKVNGKLHREDGAAIEYSNGDKSWFINGELHREDGPAVEYSNGDKSWFINGKLHREGGPASADASGYKAWFIKGQYHREDGPAVENVNGYKAWYINGKLHREDGPAIEYANGTREWYIDGTKLTEEEFNVRPKKTVLSNGNIEWRVNGELHREDGPAVERINGYKAWCINGKRHREDGPAVERIDGYKAWCINGKRHREDGPAVEFPGGNKWWYINGNRHREGGPAVENANGDKAWYINGKLHREDGPAIEYSDGDKSWYINGNRHREDGPAIERVNGYKAWYIDGTKLSEEEFNARPKKTLLSNGTIEWKVNGKLHREDGPAIERTNGDRFYYKNGRIHRDGGEPAVITDIYVMWCKDGQYHREDGPAIQYNDGDCQYFIGGKSLTKDEFDERQKEVTIHKKISFEEDYSSGPTKKV